MSSINYTLIYMFVFECIALYSSGLMCGVFTGEWLCTLCCRLCTLMPTSPHDVWENLLLEHELFIGMCLGLSTGGLTLNI
jgi:hypothetical protein